MNYLHNSNQFTHYWASVHEEFDKILNSFVKRKGWLFQDLGLIAKKAKIEDIFKCASTNFNRAAHGKPERIDHFTRVIMIILDAAKAQWLAPWRTYVKPVHGKIPPYLKRQVGGFFLLYMLYLSQPLPVKFHRKQRIIMDPRDILAMHVFNATMQTLPKSNDELKELGRQLVILFNDLVLSEAFEFSAFNDVFVTPSTSVRRLLATKYCNMTSYIFDLKDVRDQLHYITEEESLKVFRATMGYGRHLLKAKTASEEKLSRESQPLDSSTAASRDSCDKKPTIFPQADKTWSLMEIKALENEPDIGKIAHCLPGILKSLDIGPVLTRSRFAGYDAKMLDREMQHYLDNFKAQRKPIDYSRKKNLRKKLERSDSGKDISLTVWKDYLTENHNWIESVLYKNSDVKKEEIVSDSKNLGDNFEESSAPLSETFVKEEIEIEEDLTGSEWETDEDDELIEDEMNSSALELDESEKELSTPVKKRMRVPMSMPSI